MALWRTLLRVGFFFIHVALSARLPFTVRVISFDKWTSGDRVAMQSAFNQHLPHLQRLGSNASLSFHGFLDHKGLFEATRVVLLDPNLTAVVGAYFSAYSKAIYPFLSDSSWVNVPQISYGSTSAQMSDFKFFVRTCNDLTSTSRGIVTLMKYFEVRSFSTITDTTGVGAMLPREQAVLVANRQNLNFVGDVSLAGAATLEQISRKLINLQSETGSTVNVVFAGSTTTDIVFLLKLTEQAIRLKMTHGYMWLNVEASCLDSNILVGSLAITTDKAHFDRWKANDMSSVGGISIWSAYASDAIDAIMRASIALIQQGIDPRHNKTQMTPALKRVSFLGASGNVSFDDRGDRIFDSYSIVNLNASHEVVAVGFITDDVVRLTAPVTFPGPTLKRPSGRASILKLGVLFYTDIYKELADACAKFVKQNTSLLPGYELRPFSYDTGGVKGNSTGQALAALGFAFRDQVFAVIGPYFTKNAWAIQPQAQFAKLPLIAYGPWAAGLSSLPFFLRTCVSNKDAMLMVAAMCTSISLTHVAALHTPLWDKDIPVWDNIVRSNGLVNTGTARTEVNTLHSMLQKLRHDTVRFVLILTLTATDSLLEKWASPSICDTFYSTGVAWWVVEPIGDVDAARCRRMVGWLHGKLYWNAQLAMFKQFNAVYTKLTGHNFSTRMAGPKKDCKHSCDAASLIAVWNAVLAIAHGLRGLFARSVYPHSPTFSTQLVMEMKALRFEGAGSNVSIDRDGDAINDFEITSLHQNGTGHAQVGSERAVASWSQRQGLRYRHSVVWPDGLPSDPTPIVTIAYLRDHSEPAATAQAIALASAHVNADRNILPNVTLRVLTRGFTTRSEMLKESQKIIQAAGRYFVSGIIGAFRASDTYALNLGFGGFSRPQVTFASGSSMFDSSLKAGWLFHTCGAETIQAHGIVATMLDLKWKQMAMLREPEGVNFETTLRAMFSSKGVAFAAHVQASNTEISSRSTTIREKLKYDASVLGITVWALWTTAPLKQLLALMNDAGQIGPGKSSFLPDLQVPPNPHLAIGCLAVHQNIRLTFNAWVREHVDPSSHNATTREGILAGYAYETLMLYGHALHRMRSLGGAPTDSKALVAAMKGVSFAGVVHDTVSMTASGRSAAPYFLFNFVETQWRSAGTWNAETGKFLLSLKDKIIFSDNSDVPPPSSNLLTIAALLPLGGSNYVPGKWMIASMEAAAKYVNEDHGLLKGFKLKVLAKNSKCKPEEAMRDLLALRQETRVDLVIGLACSQVAAGMEKLSRGAHLPAISTGAASSEVSGSNNFFLRFAPSTIYRVRLAADIALSVGLKSLGGVVSSEFPSLRQRFHGIVRGHIGFGSPCGCAVLPSVNRMAAPSPENIMPLLNGIYEAGCRAVVVAALRNGNRLALMNALLASNSRLLEPGTVWMAPAHYLGGSRDGSEANEDGWHVHGIRPSNLDGWIAFEPSVNVSDPLYQRMKVGFHKEWLMAYNAGWNKVNYTEPTLLSVTSWNAVVASATVMTSMFSMRNPPIYQYAKKFAEVFVNELKNLTTPGAGLPFEVDEAGDGVFPFLVTNVRALRRGAGLSFFPIGNWSSRQRFSPASSTQRLVWPGGQKPLEPEKVTCPPGSRNKNTFECENCTKGRYTATEGAFACVECKSGRINFKNNAIECAACPFGAVCNGGSHIMPKEGYYQFSESLYYKCMYRSACPAGRQSAYASNSSPGNVSKCDDKFDGVLCGMCVKGPT